MPLVEQELLTLSEHLSSPPVFCGVRVTRSVVLYVCFVDRCLSFCTFSFGHCVVCSSIYGFWLPLWYLQTLLTVAIFFISEYFKLEWYNNQISAKLILSHLLYPFKARLVTCSQGSTPYISRWRIGDAVLIWIVRLWYKSLNMDHSECCVLIVPLSC